MRATDRPRIETIVDLDLFEMPLSMLLPAAIERAASTDLVLAPAHLRAAFGMRVKREGARHSPVFCDCAGRPL